MHDLVIRRGRVADGLGGPLVEADVAIDGGRIVTVGTVAERGREEIDADGLVVTPGFVDVHTHYDGQATWDPLLTPSIWHGVTTVITGNCGVGFAPAAPDRREWLIGLMEGVEDIPGVALREAIKWDWETVPEYLDALDRLPRALDVGAQIAHGAVRAYVMGERGAANEAPTADDLDRMAEIVRAGIAAGAVGFSTNRLPLHKAIDGRPVPGTFAEEDELFTLGRAVRSASPSAEAVPALRRVLVEFPVWWTKDAVRGRLARGRELLSNCSARGVTLTAAVLDWVGQRDTPVKPPCPPAGSTQRSSRPCLRQARPLPGSELPLRSPSRRRA